MKKLMLSAAVAILGLATFTPVSQGYESSRRDDRDHRDYRDDRDHRGSDLRQIRAELRQLDVLFSRVEQRLRYRAPRWGRSEYTHLLRDRQRLDYQLDRRPVDRSRVRRQIDRIREDLRRLDARLRYSDRRW